MKKVVKPKGRPHVEIEYENELNDTNWVPVLSFEIPKTIFDFVC